MAENVGSVFWEVEVDTSGMLRGVRQMDRNEEVAIIAHRGASASAPENTHNEYLIVPSNHFDIPRDVKKEIVEWVLATGFAK